MFRFIFSKTFIIQLFLAAMVCSGAVVGAYFYLKSYTRQSDVVELPSLEGYDVFEADAFLGELELEAIIIDSLYLPEKHGGIIVNQEPIANSKVKKGRKIYLTITRYNAPMVKLPDIEDQTIPLALAKLSSYGIEVGEMINKPGLCTDCVIGVEIDGKKIDPGTAIQKGKRINLIISDAGSGEKIAVPMLFGLNIEEAQNLLNLEGLNLGASPYFDCENAEDSSNAIVYRQSPTPGPGEKITQGASISVYLSPDKSLIPEDVNVDSIKARLR